MAAGPSLPPGTVLGDDYVLESELGSGGMGRVYRARQRSTGRHRAVKVLHAWLETDPKARARFLEEARIGARIGSEHVVEVLAAGFDEATRAPWLAMELLEGEDLAARIARAGPLDPPLARSVFAQLRHALGAAHANGIVHRDLKPENLFLGQPRRHGAELMLKVLDFGIAKSLELGRTAATATQAVGSPLYMAPEQSGEGLAIRPATDVWALGLIAFTALTGRPYWRAASGARSLQGLFAEVLVDPIAPASVRAAELGVAERLPPGFDAWFASCVDRRPEQRFRDAGACLAALDALLASAPPRVDPQAATLAAPSIVAPTAPMPSGPGIAPTAPMAPEPTPALPRARLGLVVAAIAASGVLVGGAAVAVLASRDGDPAPTTAEAPEAPVSEVTASDAPSSVIAVELTDAERQGTQSAAFLTRPGVEGEVWVDGVRWGRAPIRRDLTPGVHAFAWIRDDGVHTYKSLVAVGGREGIRRMNAGDARHRRPGRGTLVIESDLPLEVTVAGRRIEDWRGRPIDATPGTVEVVLRHPPSGRREVIQARITAGGATTILRQQAAVQAGLTLVRTLSAAGR